MQNVLAYAQNSTVKIWPKRLLRLLAVILIVLTAVACWRCWPLLSRRANLLYLQERCQHVSLDNQAVAVVSKPSTASKSVIFGSWAALHQLVPPTPRADYYNDRSDGTVFIGACVSPVGHRRLVAVNFSVGCEHVDNQGRSWSPPTIACWVKSSIIVPGSLLSDPKEVTIDYPGCIYPFTLRPGDLIMPAVPDPIDRSHLQFRCKSKYYSAIIDGWLCDDENFEWGERRFNPDGSLAASWFYNKRKPPPIIAPQ